MLELFGHVGQLGGGQVRLNLPEVAHARNGQAHRRVGQGELESRLGQCVAAALQIRGDFPHFPDRTLEAVAHEIAVAEIPVLEAGGLGQLPRQGAFVEGHPGDHPDTSVRAGRKQLGGGLLLEDVVDQLHRIETTFPDGLHEGVLVVLGSRDAEEAQLAFLLELVQDLQRPGVPVPGPGPGVQQEHVDGLGLEVGQALFHVLPQEGFGVAVLPAAVGGRRPGSRRRGALGGHDHPPLVTSFPEHAAHDPLAAAVAVTGGGVDEVDAQVQGPVQGPDRVLVALAAPGAADRPGAEADLGHLQSGGAELPVLHDPSSSIRPG